MCALLAAQILFKPRGIIQGIPLCFTFFLFLAGHVAASEISSKFTLLQRRIFIYQDISGSIRWEKVGDTAIEGLKANEYFRVRDYLHDILFANQVRLTSMGTPSGASPSAGEPAFDEIVTPAPLGLFPLARNGDTVCFYWFGERVVPPAGGEPCQSVKDERVELRLAPYSTINDKWTNYVSMVLDAYRKFFALQQSSSDSILWVIISDEKPDVNWRNSRALTPIERRELEELGNRFVETNQFRLILRTKFLASTQNRKNEIFIRVVSVADRKWLERLQNVERDIAQLRREIEQGEFDSVGRASLLNRLEQLETAVKAILAGREPSKAGLAELESGLEGLSKAKKAEEERTKAKKAEEERIKRERLTKIFEEIEQGTEGISRLLPDLRSRGDSNLFSEVEGRLARIREEFNRLKAIDIPPENDLGKLAESVRRLRIYVNTLLGKQSYGWLLWILLFVIGIIGLLMWRLFAGLKTIDHPAGRGLKPIKIWKPLSSVRPGETQTRENSDIDGKDVNFILEYWATGTATEGSFSGIEIRNGSIRAGEKLHLGNRIPGHEETQSLRIEPLSGYYLWLDKDGKLQILPGKDSERGILVEFEKELKRPINGVRLIIRKATSTTEQEGRTLGHGEH